MFRRVDTVAALNAALQQAQADGRPVVLDRYADWCTSCKVKSNAITANSALPIPLVVAVPYRCNYRRPVCCHSC
ncbi:hypothetical protein GJQ55_11345 [Venatoribacter cucullus]|uniref:Thioredoxin domain-containing protein n=1 Tax=Venatoribacter cucullus TaxID=2661630 RepID=A0A9X7UY31_9GAMM|nr:hypothetical protein GJQ55_11345 [Venatoribacter cucullus]